MSNDSATGTRGVGSENSSPVAVVRTDENGQNVPGGSWHAQATCFTRRLPLDEVTVAVLDGDPAVPPASIVIDLPEVCGIAIRSVELEGAPGATVTRTRTTDPAVALTDVPRTLATLLPFWWSRVLFAAPVRARGASKGALARAF